MTASTPLFAADPEPGLTVAELQRRRLRHANGKNTPYQPDGLNHFIGCPDRERFKRK